MASLSSTSADLLLRVGVDASGVATELSSKLTAAERAAVTSGNRISSAAGKTADKVQAANLRVVAAQERYNGLLLKEGATQGQIASAQASLITARRSATRAIDTETAATARLTHQSSLLGGIFKGFVAGSAGFAIAGFLRGGIEEVKQFQSGIAQTRAGIKSTGAVANVSAAGVQNLASQIQSYSGFEDDAVVAGANLLLTFRNVRNEAGANNDIFNRTVKAAADLQARGFGPLETNAKSLGKALNDPTTGMTALRRSGITFSADQIKTIKALQETGQLLQAQKLILKEVETQVGGSAKAYGQTLPGEIDRAKRSLENFEQATLQTTAPALKALAGVAQFFADHKTARDAALFAGGTTAALILLAKGIRTYETISGAIVARQAAKVAANTAVAASYDKIAVSAGRAAEAETAEAGAGGGGLLGKAAGVGKFGVGALLTSPIGLTLGIAGAATLSSHNRAVKAEHDLADSIATPADLAKAKARLQQINRLAASAGGRPDLFVEHQNLVNAIADAEPKIKQQAAHAGKVAAAAFTQAFKASDAAKAFAQQDLFSGGQRAQNVADAKKTLDEAIKARDDASRTLEQARNTTGGSGGASATDIRVAELRVQAAREAAQHKGTTTSEQATLLSAEQRLNDLRSKGKATADQTVTSENRIATAIGSQKAAQDRVNEARKALDNARGISAQSALKKIQDDARAQGQLRGDVAKLIARGASQEELQSLKSLEAQSPGTIHRIATTTGEKFNAEFNKALTKINSRTSAIEKLFDGAETVAEKRGERIAAKLHKGIVGGLGGLDFRVYFTELGAGSTPSKATSRGVRNKVSNAGFGAA